MADNKYCNLVGTNKIVDEFEKINTGFGLVDADVKALDSRVDEIITTPIGSEGSAQELIDARGGADTLGDRLDNINTAKADITYVDTEIAAVASGAPKGAYNTISELEAAFPTGDANIYLVQGNIAEVASLEVIAAPSLSGNVTITLNGVAKTVALSTATETTPALAAAKIRATAFTGWTTGGSGSVVTFTATAGGAKTDATYNAGTTGATGTMTTTTQGVDADGHWYYWTGSAWTAGGVYQGIAPADGSITTAKFAKDAGIQLPWLADNTFNLDYVWAAGTYVAAATAVNNPLGSSGVLKVERSKSSSTTSNVWVTQTITGITTDITFRRVISVNESTSVFNYIRPWVLLSFVASAVPDGFVASDMIADEAITTDKLDKDAGIQLPWLSDASFDLDNIWDTGAYMVANTVVNNPLGRAGMLKVERARSASTTYVWVMQTITGITSDITYRRILYIHESTSEIIYMRPWIILSPAEPMNLELSIVNQDWAQLERNYTWKTGYYKYWNGTEFVEKASGSFKYSDPIPVTEGEIWRVVTWVPAGSTWSIYARGYLLDADGVWVQHLLPETGSQDCGVSTIVIPHDVTHMVVVGKSYTDYRATRLLKLHDFENVWDVDTYGKTDGKYIDNDGVEQINADLSYTGAIPVTAGEIYRIANVNGGSGATFSARGVFLDASDALIGVIPANPDSLPIITFNDVIVPVGATKMVVNFFNNIITRTDVYKSMTINKAIPTTPIYANNSRIRGKNWVSYGDSITYYAEWQKGVENAIGIKSRELGYSSASITTHHADNNLCDTTRLDDLIALNPEIITIMGGDNDDSSVLIGDESDMAVEMGTEDKTEFIGAYSYIIKYILTALPEVRLILMTNTCTDASPDNVRYAQKVKVLGEYFGLEVIDVRSAIGMNVYTEYIYTSDRVHLSYRAVKRAVNKVVDHFMRT